MRSVSSVPGEHSGRPARGRFRLFARGDDGFNEGNEIVGSADIGIISVNKLLCFDKRKINATKTGKTAQHDDLIEGVGLKGFDRAVNCGD